jgi:hypothetical protein
MHKQIWLTNIYNNQIILYQLITWEFRINQVFTT